MTGIKEIDISGANRFETWTKTREASRGVIVRGGEILLSHEKNVDWWLIPGGGMEAGETPEECCVREVEEETGLIVRPIRLFLIMNEYYEEWRYVSYYYVCEPAGTGQRRLTEAEKRRGAQPEWVSAEEALSLFSRHQEYDGINEEKRGIYLREYTALNEYMRSFSG